MRKPKLKMKASNTGCPNCGSPEMLGGPWDNTRDEVQQAMECLDCGTKWIEVYRFAYRIVNPEEAPPCSDAP